MVVVEFTLFFEHVVRKLEKHQTQGGVQYVKESVIHCRED